MRIEGSMIDLVSRHIKMEKQEIRKPHFLDGSTASGYS